MKTIIIILSIGLVLTMMGILAKLEGWLFFDRLLVIGIAFGVLGLVLAIWNAIIVKKLEAF